jgi:hypothetical protein
MCVHIYTHVYIIYIHTHIYTYILHTQTYIYITYTYICLGNLRHAFWQINKYYTFWLKYKIKRKNIPNVLEGILECLQWLFEGKKVQE